jgi:hypothetical protein
VASGGHHEQSEDTSHVSSTLAVLKIPGHRI